MIKRDEVYRKELFETHIKAAAGHMKNGLSIEMPPPNMTFWEAGSGANTPRANGGQVPITPGFGIRAATPGVKLGLQGVPENGSPLDKKTSQASRSSAEKSGDYFTNASAVGSTADNNAVPATPSAVDEKSPNSPADPDKSANGKESGSRFGKSKKFKMSFKKGLSRSASSAAVAVEKPAVVDEKEEGSESSEPVEKEYDDSFLGIVQRIRTEYDKELLENPTETLECFITPSLPNETPVLKPPPMTTVIIQEETSGGSADLYRGTVDTVGEDASLIEQKAPLWLGDLLLRVSRE